MIFKSDSVIVFSIFYASFITCIDAGLLDMFDNTLNPRDGSRSLIPSPLVQFSPLLQPQQGNYNYNPNYVRATERIVTVNNRNHDEPTDKEKVKDLIERLNKLKDAAEKKKDELERNQSSGTTVSPTSHVNNFNNQSPNHIETTTPKNQNNNLNQQKTEQRPSDQPNVWKKFTRRKIVFQMRPVVAGDDTGESVDTVYYLD